MDSTFTQTSYPTPSDSTLDSSSTVIESPDFQKSTLSPYLNRSRFHRRNSVTEHDTEYHGAGGGDGGYHQTSSGQGLGISDLGTPTITPGSADPLLPSPWSSPVYKDFGDNKAGGRHTKEGDKEYTGETTTQFIFNHFFDNTRTVDLHGRRGPPSTPTSSLGTCKRAFFPHIDFNCTENF